METGTLHVLTGCTAVGKSERAIGWALERGAEIVSCDSLLFYRGMDIGTAKPPAADRARIPHHLIDILGVAERMDVARYVALARAAVGDISGRGRPVLVVGGSGFYLKAFLGPVADTVAVPPEIRERVAALLGQAGPGALVVELRRLNPEGLGALDTANPRRVARALERCLASGRPLAALAADFARQPGPFAGWRVSLQRLDAAPAELDRRIGARTDAMLRSGLVEEVRGLLDAGLRNNPSAARAIGYREVIAMLEGRLPASSLREAIVRSTRALVKKQRTWFRTQLPPHSVVA
jgi:tRNA dimethylallyltransferase